MEREGATGGDYMDGEGAEVDSPPESTVHSLDSLAEPFAHSVGHPRASIEHFLSSDNHSQG